MKRLLITVFLLGLSQMPTYAQSGDTAANIRAADIRNRESGTHIGDLSLDESLLADYRLAQEYRRDAESYEKSGKTKLEEKRRARALEIAERVARREPTWLQAWLLVGQLRLDLKLWEEAREAYRLALIAEPENAEARRGFDWSEIQIRLAGAGDGQ